MPRIRIVGPAGDAGGLVPGYATRVFIDDKEIKDVRSIQFSAVPDSVAELRLSMFVSDDSEIEIDANVFTEICPLTQGDGVIVEVSSQRGNRRYRIVRPEGATA